MAFTNTNAYVFTPEVIRAYAPESSGVYGIFNQANWIYIGESNNIRRRLLEHYAEIGTCIKHSQPSGFIFELVPAYLRVAQQNALISELRPGCNLMFG